MKTIYETGGQHGLSLNFMPLLVSGSLAIQLAIHIDLHLFPEDHLGSISEVISHKKPLKSFKTHLLSSSVR